MTDTLQELTRQFHEAQALYDSHKFDEAAKLLKSLYPQMLRQKDKKLKGDFLALSGHSEFHLGQYEECLKKFAEAEVIFKELKLVHELSSVESSFGATYHRLGLYAHALFKSFEALTYCVQTNDDYGMACCLVNAANSLVDTDRGDRAFRAFDAAILICDRHEGEEKFELVRLLSYNGKAIGCGKASKHDEMLKLLEQAREVIKKHSIPSRLNLIDSNIAACLMKLNRYEEAYQIVKVTVKKRKNLPEDHYMSNLMKMAVIKKEHFHDNEGFLKYMNMALKLAERMNILYRQTIILKQLKEHYSSINDHVRLGQTESKLRMLEEQDSINKQTGGMEKFFDAILLSAEEKLREKEQTPEFLNRCDYLIGAYIYTYHGVTRHVPLRDIAFCEIKDNDLHIFTFAKSSSGQMLLTEGHRIRKTMKEFIAEINDSDAFFARIHNSFIVNLGWLSRDSMKGASSLSIGGRELKISDTYRSQFKKKLNAFLESEYNLQ